MKKNIDISFFFFVFFLMTLSLGQLARFHFGSVVFYPHDVVIAIAFFTHLVTKQVFSLPSVDQPKRFLLPLMLLGWIVLGWAMAATQHTLTTQAVLTFIRLLVYVVFMASLLANMRTISAVAIRCCVFFTGFLMSGWGILQYVLLPDVRFLHTFGWDDHYYRLIGPLLDPNFAGLLTILTLFYWQSCAHLVKRYTQKTLNSGVKLFHLINNSVWLVLFTSLAMTFSRSSWLALIGSLALMAFWPKTRPVITFKIVGIWVCILIGSYVFLPKPTGEGVDITRTSTISARTDLNRYLLSSMQPLDWVIGKGAFNFRVATEPKSTGTVPTTAIQPDNVFVQLVGSIGVGGILLVILLLWQKRQTVSQLDPWLVGIIWAVLIHAQFNNSLFQPQILLLLLAGVVRPLSAKKLD